MDKIILDAMNKRYATRRFDKNKKLDEETLNTILEAGRLSPSSYGLQPWQFIIVEDMDIRNKLSEVGYHQPQLTEASHLIVITARDEINEEYIDEYLKLIADTRGLNEENKEKFKKTIIGALAGQSWGTTMNWNMKQTYVALGIMIETAALLGVNACPMDGFKPAEFDEVLKLEGTGFKTVALLTLGYKTDDDPDANLAKVRFPKEKIIKRI